MRVLVVTTAVLVSGPCWGQAPPLGNTQASCVMLRDCLAQGYELRSVVESRGTDGSGYTDTFYLQRGRTIVACPRIYLKGNPVGVDLRCDLVSG